MLIDQYSTRKVFKHMTKAARDLPQNPEAMQSASIEDLEQVLNQPRHNPDMIAWVHEAVEEVQRRGLTLIGSGEGPYTIQQ
jgi:galactokinase